MGKVYTGFLIILFLCSVNISFANEDSIKKYRNYTPEQIQKIPKETISNDVPLIYVFAAQKGLSVDSNLVFAMELNMLMYPGIHDYEKAIKAFQTDLGDQPTGKLTVWQIDKLTRRAAMQKLSQVYFPNSFLSSKTNDYALVEGTNILLDEKIAYPVNYTTIVCSKEEGNCKYEQIPLYTPKNEDSNGQFFQLLEPIIEYYNITRWSEDIIDGTLTNENENSCRTTSLNFNFKTKEFFFITRNGSKECEFAGTKLPKLDKPRIGQIVDGKDIMKKEFDAIQEAAFKLLSKDFQKKVEEKLNELKKKK
jgi:hypothetical protein